MDEIVASQVNGTWYNHHYDAQGNCILLSTAGGGIEEQYDYDAFGFPYFYTASGDTPATVKTRFLFTGREWLNDLRIYDYRNRMYQPELGRFLQPDPKQFDAGDYNFYRYCHNDPVNKTDPTGLVHEGPLGPEPQVDLSPKELAVAVGLAAAPFAAAVAIEAGGAALVSFGARLTVGAGATKILSDGSKQTAMAAAKLANLPRAVLSAIGRSTSSSNVIVSRTGDATVVTATRLGANGAQTIVTVVKSDGTKTVVQIAVDKGMKIDHVHLKQ